MCYLLQSYMEFLTILGTTALMASSLRHTGEIQSLHHQNLAQNSFDSIVTIAHSFTQMISEQRIVISTPWRVLYV